MTSKDSRLIGELSLKQECRHGLSMIILKDNPESLAA